ncbi:TPA: bifunctional diaminohydroxyphosphoribosylaminopyrimidine deaminase/5-amino-6-(5-phosphoribosylamino)uracil reductase RibD [Candidatus Poribacteria bacterium]|nr:bifunctional diaminohydroxyphosphoribosylaminopyrimidine deaminase/5-amino-6-(5-phosphoribosylamino)uracil reductase RibD [Candidatus Poribacteria bacterium]HIC01569.1 bifunctional diaminohydroxyphosphoribosylaminopyrimidine deaminase/5-amino-6-(5-phosphoribosylamino)uracil reductase RibD [Candidatus Poribacteria bacterium]HIO78829.1 bifunctional diaminohydroxyphosphoribosylaminopyrimidine deaminase/5-amino-6-(5-phosphoribosylamino)uracil reductase RibD [Candidatus Poribacteria bacterium]
MGFSEVDQCFMHRAIDLAAKASGRTSPNPMVGAVIVNTGQIVGEGYHKQAGTPHAEPQALNQAKGFARGATMYVTLEPCCHWGQTPPCTDIIVQSGISKIFVAIEDPNPIVAGKGIEQIRQAGIEVEVGLCHDEAYQLNEIFIKNMVKKQPFVILKAATSLDGKIATVTGDSQWITSPAARQKGHGLRDTVDAILVGIGTVFRDNPSLTTRLLNRDSQDPIRIIVDSCCRTPIKAKIFNPESRAKVIIATTEFAPRTKMEELESAGADVLIVDSNDKRVCLTSLMNRLIELGITSILIEGGSEIHASALDAGIVDKVMFFVAPKLIGGQSAPGVIGGNGITNLSEAIDIHNWEFTKIGEDFLIEGYLN